MGGAQIPETSRTSNVTETMVNAAVNIGICEKCWDESIRGAI